MAVSPRRESSGVTQCSAVPMHLLPVDVRCITALLRGGNAQKMADFRAIRCKLLCSGRRGRRFESSHSDQTFQRLGSPVAQRLYQCSARAIHTPYPVMARLDLA
jgi:hypothetical protein